MRPAHTARRLIENENIRFGMHFSHQNVIKVHMQPFEPLCDGSRLDAYLRAFGSLFSKCIIGMQCVYMQHTHLFRKKREEGIYVVDNCWSFVSESVSHPPSAQTYDRLRGNGEWLWYCAYSFLQYSNSRFHIRSVLQISVACRRHHRPFHPSVSLFFVLISVWVNEINGKSSGTPLQ